MKADLKFPLSTAVSPVLRIWPASGGHSVSTSLLNGLNKHLGHIT